MPTSTDVVLDLVAAYPHIGVLKAALARRDWPACRKAIDSGNCSCGAACSVGRVFLIHSATAIA